MLVEFLWCSILGSKGIFSEAHLGRLLDMSPGLKVLVEISNSRFRGVSEVCFLAVSSLLDVLVEILWFPYIRVSRFEFPCSSFLLRVSIYSSFPLRVSIFKFPAERSLPHLSISIRQSLLY